MSKFQKLGLFFIGLITFPCLNAQVISGPGDIQKPHSWVATKDGKNLAANYHTIDLKTHSQDLGSSSFLLHTSSTIFLVLKPEFDVPISAGFLQIADIGIYDDKVISRADTFDLVFENMEPLILTITRQGQYRYARRLGSEVVWGDSSLYGMAEMVVYQGILSREDIRKVNTYLSLKYSIPITKVKEVAWRNYLKGDNQTYWSASVDVKFNERVTALGRRNAEAVFQTQTVTTTGIPIRFALDQFEPLGAMPSVQVSDRAFIVFSERKDIPQPSTLCLSRNKGKSNPLLKWKFQLQSWDSQAKTILIEVGKGKKGINDSLFVTDGFYKTYVPVISQTDSLVQYGVPLSGLVDGMHYFFTTKSDANCEDVVVEVSNDTIVVANKLDVPVVVEIQSLVDGRIESLVIGGSIGSIATMEGQQLISVTNQDGQLIYTGVVFGQTETNQIQERNLAIKVYPNPSKHGEQVDYEITGFSETELVLWMVVDGLGQLIQKGAFEKDQPRMGKLRFPHSGTYTLAAWNAERLLACKVIVLGN